MKRCNIETDKIITSIRVNLPKIFNVVKKLNTILFEKNIHIIMHSLLTLALISFISILDINHPYLFHQYQNEYGKQYSVEEYTQRFNNFKDNVEIIFKNIKTEDRNYTLGFNQFTDQSTEEFSKNFQFEYKNLIGNKCKTMTYTGEEVPKEKNWVTLDAVTPVKNQGQCGSCWSFSATGAIEGANAITNGKLASLSEQELVDCSKRYGNMGCNGGLMDNAFHYVIDNGLCSESDYPYTASDDTCVSTDCTPIVKISDCADVIVNNELALKEAVSKQPVSVAIEADTKTFQLYSSGVLTSDSCGTNLDHGVLVVGYGTEDDTPYWLVKNSWGDTWGEDGYIKIGRSDSESSKGICGIAMQPSYPIV